MPQSRRSFLATLGAAAIAGAIRPGSTQARGAQLDRIGLQLYTVRTEMRRDVAVTLERVAAIGYKDVEFAGYFDETPGRIAALLRGTGLAAPSAHIDFGVMRDDWPRALDEAAAIGHTYVTVPWIDADARRTPDDWKRVAALFNERAQQARGAGLRFAYHNHDFEFDRAGDALPFDVLIGDTDPDLVAFELDVYWMTKAGYDPLDYFRRYPGRFHMTHLKDSGGAPDHRMLDVGSGSIDFGRIIEAATAAGVRHHFVEHDQPDDPFESARASYAHLSSLIS